MIDSEKITWDIIRLFLIPKFEELGYNASGQFIETLEARKNEIWGMNYFKFLVDGRAPNRNQDNKALWAWANWASEAFIKEWARNKGIPEEAAIPIAYNIAKNGTNDRPNRQDLINILTSDEVKNYISKQYQFAIINSVTEEFRKYKW